MKTKPVFYTDTRLTTSANKAHWSVISKYHCYTTINLILCHLTLCINAFPITFHYFISMIESLHNDSWAFLFPFKMRWAPFTYCHIYHATHLKVLTLVSFLLILIDNFSCWAKDSQLWIITSEWVKQVLMKQEFSANSKTT